MYSKCGNAEQVLDIWEALKREGIDNHSKAAYVIVLTACASLRSPRAVDIGQAIHAEVQLHTCTIKKTDYFALPGN